MFYNERLLCRGGRAHAAWASAWPLECAAGAANHARRSVHDLCVDLKHWVKSRSGDPRRRLALRTSATLVAGTANAYRLQVDDLLSDVIQLNAMMEATRRQSCASFGSHHDQESPSSSKRWSSGPSMDTSSDDSTDRGQMPTPEIMRRRTSARFSLDIPSIRTSSEGTGKVEKSFHHRMVDLSNTRHSSVFENNIDSDNTSPFGSLNGHLPNNSRIEGELSKGNGDERLEERKEEESELVSETLIKLSKRPNKSKSASNGCNNSGTMRSKRRRYDSEWCDPDGDEQRAGTVDVATQTDDLQEPKSKSASNGRDNSGTMRSKRRRDSESYDPDGDEQRTGTVDVATQTDDLQEPKSKSASNGCDNSGTMRSKRRRDSESYDTDGDEQRAGTVDVATQTDDLQEPDRMANSENAKMDFVSHSGLYSKQSFDNLPLGVTLVYDARNNLIPSKLILSSLNPKLLSELYSTCSQ